MTYVKIDLMPTSVETGCEVSIGRYAYMEALRHLQIATVLNITERNHGKRMLPLARGIVAISGAHKEGTLEPPLSPGLAGLVERADESVRNLINSEGNLGSRDHELVQAGASYGYIDNAEFLLRALVDYGLSGANQSAGSSTANG